jgi:hypothetical protein
VAVSPARSKDSCPGFQRHNLGGALCKARIPQLPGLGQPVMSCFFFGGGDIQDPILKVGDSS